MDIIIMYAEYPQSFDWNHHSTDAYVETVAHPLPTARADHKQDITAHRVRPAYGLVL